jgi:acyl-CoA hydrolase
MTSVNTALEIDLFGQANASWVRGSVYSGLGGQSDFVVGALHSTGGQAILALPSWHPKADRSTVVSHLSGPASSFQHSWIVSEQGHAAVWGQTQHEQARRIIEGVAAPAARDELHAAAVAAGVLPR